MEELLKDVLIKDSAGQDKVFIIDNLPKSFLYHKGKKMMIDYTEPGQKLIPAFEVLDNGKKRYTGEVEDQLLPGIEISDSGDGAFVFYTDYNEARQRLAAIDRYIAANVPVAERVAERVSYAAQPGLMSSAPLARHLIPRVVLPELVSPPVLATAQATQTRAISNSPEAPANRVVAEPETQKAKREMSDEHKRKLAEGRAKARAAKESK